MSKAAACSMQVQVIVRLVKLVKLQVLLLEQERELALGHATAIIANVLVEPMLIVIVIVIVIVAFVVFPILYRVLGQKLATLLREAWFEGIVLLEVAVSGPWRVVGVRPSTVFVYAMSFSDGMVKAVEAVIMVATMAEYASSLVSIIEEAVVQAVVILSELPMVVELKQEVDSTISVPIQVQ